MKHRPIPQHRKVKTRAVIGDQLGLVFGDLTKKILNQFPFSLFTGSGAVLEPQRDHGGVPCLSAGQRDCSTLPE
jgi:hypothetical protein